MKILREILKSIDVEEVLGSLDVNVGGIKINSSKVRLGDLFAAVKGTRVDGHDFIPEALKYGASVILCEKIPENPKIDQTWVKVANVPVALGEIASSFYDYPSGKVKLIGITGTNGKTSVATFLYHIFEELGYPVGLISTISTRIHNQSLNATHTTPDVVKINKLVHQMVDAGCTHVFMEVSSHGLDQDRVAGLVFSGGLFTNLTHDHLDYHKTFGNYLNSKKKFFDNLPEKAFALINVDDKNGKVMVQNTKARTFTYGIKQLADFNAKVIERTLDGTLIRVGKHEIWIPFIGDFNIYNLLAAYATSINLEMSGEEVLKIISKLKPVPGRFETVRSGEGRIAIVDYAHTPDALLNVLQSIHQIRKTHSKIITVVGAGGDRDKEKRPVMARIGAEKSDTLILTSDNPRSEPSEEIIKDMEQGIPDDIRKKVLSISNRKEAIRTACMMAERYDIILIAGKGHETYQEIDGKRQHFDDREVVREIFTQIEAE